MFPNNPGPSLKNAEKSRILASALFPGEEWVYNEPGIWVARSRLIERRKEQAKLSREISHIRILTSRGSTASFLPETEQDKTGADNNHNLRADTVMDGEVVELKCTGGNRETIGKCFRRGYKQGRSLLKKHGIRADHSVFIRLFSRLIGT